jgi:hypothetical protein
VFTTLCQKDIIRKSAMPTSIMDRKNSTARSNGRFDFGHSTVFVTAVKSINCNLNLKHFTCKDSISSQYFDQFLYHFLNYSKFYF